MFHKKEVKLFVNSKKVRTFASLLRKTRAFSSAGSEHLPYKQRVGGSNPSTPTYEKTCHQQMTGLFFYFQTTKNTSSTKAAKAFVQKH